MRAKLWTRPVSLLTKVEGKGKLLRCEDGNISERSAEYLSVSNRAERLSE